ncbi:MAG: hypothetical protein ABI967_07385 [bacterium]
MEEYTLSNESLAASEPLTLPHFDEEATLLSARPVVPLHEVKGKARSNHRLAFGLAIAAAVVAGALGASVIYKQRDDQQQIGTSEIVNPTTEPAEASKAFVSASGDAGGIQIKTSEHPMSAPLADTKAQAEPKIVSTSVTARPKTSPPNRDRVPQQDGTSGAARYQDDQMRADEIDQRSEDRRAERRLRRERRDGRDRASDEVIRIREIFEGRPRP